MQRASFVLLTVLVLAAATSAPVRAQPCSQVPAVLPTCNGPGDVPDAQPDGSGGAVTCAFLPSGFTGNQIAQTFTIQQTTWDAGDFACGTSGGANRIANVAGRTGSCANRRVTLDFSPSGGSLSNGHTYTYWVNCRPDLTIEHCIRFDSFGTGAFCRIDRGTYQFDLSNPAACPSPMSSESQPAGGADLLTIETTEGPSRIPDLRFGPCSCCTGGDGNGCDDPPCENAVCGFDPSCCVLAWDETCDLIAAGTAACSCCEETGLTWKTPPDVAEACNCCTGGSDVGCDNPICRDVVCGVEPSCCIAGWSRICDAIAQSQCGCCGRPPHYLYDVVSGSLDALLASQGSFAFSVEDCPASDYPETYLPDPVGVPDPGEGRYVLIRVDGDTWNVFAGLPESRDPELFLMGPPGCAGPVP